jgi:hypothetical protein
MLESFLESHKFTSNELFNIKHDNIYHFQKLGLDTFKIESIVEQDFYLDSSEDAWREQTNTFLEKESIFADNILHEKPSLNKSIENNIIWPYIYRILIPSYTCEKVKKYATTFSHLSIYSYYHYKDHIDSINFLQTKFQGTWLFKEIQTYNNKLIGFTRGDAQIGITETVLALCRYHAKNDKYPETLHELVPDFLPFVPIDPFDGKPMRMKQANGKILIYSVGEDCIDDGGKDFSLETRKGDFVFKIPLTIDKK